MYPPGPQKRKVTQDLSSTFFLRCVPYFSREKGSDVSFISLVDREVELCVQWRSRFSGSLFSETPCIAVTKSRGTAAPLFSGYRTAKPVVPQ